MGGLPLAALFSVLFQPLDGDLTRIGGYTERDFGWNSQQPAITITYSGKAIQRPEVLVFGDSFSAGNVWQSVLGHKTRQTFLTFHYLGQAGCPDNWVHYASTHNSVQTVVVEIIEREFINIFGETGSCPWRIPTPLEISPATLNSARKTFPPEWHLSQTLRTAWTRFKSDLHPNNKIASGSSINAAIDPACANFSNRRADRLLYYADDEQKIHWKEADIQRAIKNVLHIQQALQANGRQFLFVLVPDKLSVYQHCLREDPERAERQRINITQRLRDRGVRTPDLQGEFRRHLPGMVDLYYPNNTHLSWNGYALMADILANALRQPNPPETLLIRSP